MHRVSHASRPVPQSSMGNRLRSPELYFRESCELQLTCSCADWQKL